MFTSLKTNVGPLFSPLWRSRVRALILIAGVISAVALVGGVMVLRSSRGPAADRGQEAARHLGAPPASSSELSGTQPVCQSATATNCDRSKLPPAGTLGSAGCIGDGTAMLGASPIDLDEIAFIEPMGLMIGGHVTPIDHGYFYIKGAMEIPTRQAAVYSPLRGVITSVTRSLRHGPSGDYDDYALTIEATCSFRVVFSNLVYLTGGLGEAVGPLPRDQGAAVDFTVGEGELIGYTGLPTANGIDVTVEDDHSTLTGFVNPDQYTNAAPSKTHVVDLFDYTTEPLRSQLLALDMRDALPRWGKIDYDVDRELVGNWFRQGSGGFGGNQHGQDGYWSGHLSVVPDGHDPGQIDVSFGNYDGQARQFAVIGNAPDPFGVSEATGLVKYELGEIVIYRGDTGEIWNQRSYIPHIRTRAGSTVIGTVLLQLTGTRQLRVEIFPGKTAAQVAGFDSSALSYER